MEGHPVHKLVEASKSGDFDLIIMGRSNSYNWFMHYFWESKTSLICTKAHCPVLVVPQQAKFDGIQEILAIHEEGENLGFPSDANGSFTEPGQERWIHFIPLSALTFNFPFLQQVSGLFGIGTRSGECTYTKVKTKIQAYIRENHIDLLVMRTVQKRLPERTLASHYEHRLLLELDIPVLVVNRQVTKMEINELVPGFEGSQNENA